MRRLNKGIAFALSIVLIAVLAAACSGKGSTEGANGNGQTQPVEKESAEGNGQEQASANKWKVGDNVSLKWYINFNYHKDTLPWTEYPILNEVSQTTGVYPEIIIPTGNEAEKLNLMISTGDMPDILTLGYTDPAVTKLISQGMVYSYDELIEKYAPDFAKEIPDDIRNWVRNEDGKLYGLNSYFIPDYRYQEKYAIGGSTYNVRQDFYNEIGSPDMTTPDSFYEALKAFKEKYPVFDGKPSIPFSLGGDANWGATFLERSFGVKDYYEDDNYNLSIKYKHPNYLEAAKYLNKLYREGLMDKETFIQKDEQVQEKLASRVFAATSVYWFFDTANLALDKVKPGAHFMAVEPMKAVPDLAFQALGRQGWTVTLIPKKTEKPEEVIRFLRYLWSPEGNMLMYFGHEGKDYAIEDGIVKRSEAVKAEINKDRIAFMSKTGMMAMSYMFYPYYKEERVESDEVRKNREMADKYAQDESEYLSINPDPTTPEGIIKTQIDQIQSKMIPRIIMASTEDKAVSEVAEMLKQMEKVGLEKLEKYWTEQYKAERERIGLTNPPKMK